MKKRVLALLLIVCGVNVASAVVIENEVAIVDAIMPPLTSFPIAVKSDESLYSESELSELFEHGHYLRKGDSKIFNLEQRHPNWTKLFRELGGKSDATLIYSTDSYISGEYELCNIRVRDLQTHYRLRNDPDYPVEEDGLIYIDEYGAEIIYPSTFSVYVSIGSGSEFGEGTIHFSKEGTTYKNRMLDCVLRYGQHYHGANHPHSIFHAIAFFSDETFLIQRCIHQYTDVVDIKRRFIVDTMLCKMTEEGVAVLNTMRHYEE